MRRIFLLLTIAALPLKAHAQTFPSPGKGRRTEKPAGSPPAGSSPARVPATKQDGTPDMRYLVNNGNSRKKRKKKED